MKMKEKKDKKSEDSSSLSYPVSLSKYLAVCGVASRRKSTDLVKVGGVKVNGIIVVNPGEKIGSTDVVLCNDRPVFPEQKYYIMLNKPVGYVCTSDDPYASQKAIDLVDVGNVRLYSVGRLDKNSEGLLLLTNDGDYANRVIHPKYGVIKRYVVWTDRPLSAKELSKLCTGIVDDGEGLKALAVNELDSCQYEFKMGEGKKREIRRLIHYTGKKTIRLQRIAIGGLKLANLKSGGWRHLSVSERALSLKNPE